MTFLPILKGLLLPCIDREQIDRACGIYTYR